MHWFETQSAHGAAAAWAKIFRPFMKLRKPVCESMHNTIITRPGTSNHTKPSAPGSTSVLRGSGLRRMASEAKSHVTWRARQTLATLSSVASRPSHRRRLTDSWKKRASSADQSTSPISHQRSASPKSSRDATSQLQMDGRHWSELPRDSMTFSLGATSHACNHDED